MWDSLLDRIRQACALLSHNDHGLHDLRGASELLEAMAELGSALSKGSLPPADVTCFLADISPTLTYSAAARLSRRLDELTRCVERLDGLQDAERELELWTEVCWERSGLTWLHELIEYADTANLLRGEADPSDLDDALREVSRRAGYAPVVPEGVPSSHWWWRPVGA